MYVCLFSMGSIIHTYNKEGELEEKSVSWIGSRVVVIVYRVGKEVREQECTMIAPNGGTRRGVIQ